MDVHQIPEIPAQTRLPPIVLLGPDPRTPTKRRAAEYIHLRGAQSELTKWKATSDCPYSYSISAVRGLEDILLTAKTSGSAGSHGDA